MQEACASPATDPGVATAHSEPRCSRFKIEALLRDAVHGCSLVPSGEQAPECDHAPGRRYSGVAPQADPFMDWLAGVELVHAILGQVAAWEGDPFVVHLEQHGGDQSQERVVVGEDSIPSAERSGSMRRSKSGWGKAIAPLSLNEPSYSESCAMAVPWPGVTPGSLLHHSRDAIRSTASNGRTPYGARLLVARWSGRCGASVRPTSRTGLGSLLPQEFD